MYLYDVDQYTFYFRCANFRCLVGLLAVFPLSIRHLIILECEYRMFSEGRHGAYSIFRLFKIYHFREKNTALMGYFSFSFLCSKTATRAYEV